VEGLIIEVEDGLAASPLGAAGYGCTLNGGIWVLPVF
jgi:hypothetical protein